VKGDPLWTFWLYLFVRTLAELFPASVVALLDATILKMTANTGSHFGKEHIFGLIALSLFSPLCGYLMDFHNGIFGFLDFATCFYALSALMIISAILAMVLPTFMSNSDYYCKYWWRDMSQILCNVELLAMFMVLLVMGIFWGGLETFGYWYFEDLGASRLQLGLTIAAGAVLAVPLLCVMPSIVKICGHANLLIIALTFYSVRLAGYSAIVDPWMALPWEALEVFTLHLGWVAAILYTNEKAPKNLTATSQAIIVVVHFGIGRALGSFLGGLGIAKFGSRTTFKLASIAAAASAIIYLVFYHFYIKVHRCLREREFDRRLKREKQQMMSKHFYNQKRNKSNQLVFSILI
jgi:hypothetical protein